MKERSDPHSNLDNNYLSNNNYFVSYGQLQVSKRDNCLSNDPCKVDSNFLCYAATGLSHIGMLSFLHRECINLQEGS